MAYLGHRIDKDGLHPTEKKVRTIRDATIPRGVSDLKAYFEMLSYYSKFLPDRASVGTAACPFTEGRNMQIVRGLKPGIPGIKRLLTLSQAPLPNLQHHTCQAEAMLDVLKQLKKILVTATQIAWWTSNEPVLSQVRTWVRESSPHKK